LNHADALAETERRLALPGRVVIAEAAFKYENLFIRADIVVKEGDTLHLFEVKAKSASNEHDDTGAFLNKAGDKVATPWVPYLYDLAFQKYVMSKCAFSSHYKIKAHLMLANKDATASVAGLNQMFKITKTTNGYEVKVPAELTRAQLGTDILKKIQLDEVIDKIWHEFTVPNDYLPHASFEDFVIFAADLYVNDRRQFTTIGKKCKGCTYINKEQSNGLKSGFHECWKNHTTYSDALLNQPLATEIWGGKMGNISLVQRLIDHQVYLLANATDELIAASKPGNTPTGLSAFERRKIQVDKVRLNDPSSYFDAEGMAAEMRQWTYPLHMIDFETSMAALPFHQGLKPYQGVAFQFSHHVLHADGRVEHKGQFLATEPGVFPNYDFVRALKQELEHDEGTIFRYHNHENSYLNLIAAQLETHANAPADAPELLAFIRSITQRKEGTPPLVGKRNMVDLYELVLKYYYSPNAKGSNSLKQILPAIIRDSAFLRNKYGTPSQYGKELAIKSLNFDTHVWIQEAKGFDPYKTLPPVFDGLTREELDDMVKDFDELGDGGAALTAYNYLQFAEVPAEQRTRIADSLLRYCELDTLAMIMIVEGWKDLMKNKNQTI